VKNAIAPLAALPGVTLAMLVSQDGVPIVVRGDHRKDSTDTLRDAHLEDADALAGLAAGWIADLTRASAPISWNAPRYLVLRAARGSLLAMQVPRALLVVVIGSGMRPEDFRLVMESAAARVERSLRTGGRGELVSDGRAAEPTDTSNTEPVGIFPERLRTSSSGVDPRSSLRKDGVAEPQGPTGE